ncbi:T9SS type A sorting domain-containing protein [Lacinutrix sp. WUR7]|uniref:Kelch repeat-containing protein n=1 Tax=Lacinutrix sp. WUR7 TaxID=2653681 RepID=UPI00193DB6B3|nr:kelch repeat-containing protein [Lacinutrix sp. WUR7]QRM88294.1 T9SS type A sorting domain-containing protein [Lacinutrix sp. WUR7]
MKNLTKKAFFYLLLFGFISSTSNVSAQVWTDTNEDESYVARHECGFTQAGDKFFLFGGRESPRVLDVYDYASNTWSNGGIAPVDFNHFQAITYEGLIWVIGAFKTNEPNPELNADYIYMYNPASQQWIQGMELPTARKRGAAGLALHNNKFYLIGGNVYGHGGGYVAYMDVFDPATGTFTALTDAPHARDHFHAVVHNDKLYALGGRLTGGAGGLFAPQIPEVDVYDLNTNLWSTLAASSNIPTPRAGAATVLFQNEIYVIGGETTFGSATGNNGQRDIVEAFNPVTGTWTTKDNLNHYRHGIQGIVSGGGIHVIAGSSGGTSIKKMEYFGANSPTGSPNVNSVFAAGETTKTFEYGTSYGSVTIPITLSNSAGTTGTYIDNITISGVNYTLNSTYSNLLLGANQDLIIQAVLNDTSQSMSNGNVQVTYNNNTTLNIALEGTLNPTLSIANPDDLKTLKVYPNPTKSTFQINKKSTQLNVFDITGKSIKVFHGDFSEEHPFNISNFSKGIYFIQVKNDSQISETIKIIKT